MTNIGMTAFDTKKGLEEDEESNFIEFSSERKTPGLTKRLLTVAIMGVLGISVPAGYNLGVINTPQTVLEQFCNRSLSQRGHFVSRNELDLLWSFIVSVYLASAALGSLCASFLADKIGRRQTLLLNNSLGLMSAAFFAFSEVANSIELLFLGRLTVGFYSGLGSSVGPMYLMEVAPLHLRGPLGVLHQLGLTLGILISQILGQEEILGTEAMWPVLLSLYSVSVTIGLLLLPFCPECPAYLYINQNDHEKALEALVKLRGLPIELLKEDISLLKKEQKAKESNHKWTMKNILKDQTLRSAVLLMCAMHAGQQFIGISAVFYYSTNTFEKIGMTVKQSQYSSIGAGMTNFIMACIAIPLIRKCRRRFLILLSLIMSTISLLILSLSMILQEVTFWMSYITIIALVLFVCFFGLGIGPIPFMIGSELFQQGPRAAGMSVGCAVNWSANFVIAVTFPIVKSVIGEYIFLVFAFVGFLLSGYFHFNLPETKDLDPVEVTKMMKEKQLFAQVQTSFV
ncbi:solute carrier family 2, facilitated glucose transporter member 1-like [Centruroides vittatus]|uniref:solute carrier family 2, facilitated glucose transporter member 1-like n=1 Tax=Centruroides vittatus TaxID=120091 RepID=UPI00351004FE